MDNDLLPDYDEVIRTVQQAEVITFRFITVQQRLLIDNRSSEVDPPLMKLVPRARSVEERFRALKQLRPRFRLPEKISAIWWPKYVDTLAERGVWDAILGRIAQAGFPEVAERYACLLDELRQLERQELRHAICGEGYQAIWER